MRDALNIWYCIVLLKAMVLYYCVTQEIESGSFEGSLNYVLTCETLTTIDNLGIEDIQTRWKQNKKEN